MKAGVLMTIVLFFCSICSGAIKKSDCGCESELSVIPGDPLIAPNPGTGDISTLCLVVCMAFWGIASGIIAFVLMQINAGFSIWYALVSAGIIGTLITAILGCYYVCFGGSGGGFANPIDQIYLSAIEDR